MADIASTVDMAMILDAINGLRNQIMETKQDIKNELLEVKEDISAMKEDISAMKKDIRTLSLKVDQSRVLSGSLVEANIRSYFTKEYGESFSRHYVATDLSGLIYLATPRELRKKSDGYHVLSKQRANFIDGIFRSCASLNLFEYLCGKELCPANLITMQLELTKSPVGND
jgi:hypothetical protein